MSGFIDFDTHVYEPISVWSDYLDPALRDRSPQWVKKADGRLGVEVGGKLFPSLENHPGMAKIYGENSTVDRSGNDPAVRLKYMDDLNVDVQVIFPTLGMHGFSGSVADEKLAAGFARAYNRYMGEFVSKDPRRLRGAMIVPANHPEIAVQEMKWARQQNLSIIYLNPTPPGEIAWSHPSRDVFWKTVEDLGLTVVFHESTTGCPPNATGIHRYSEHWPMVYFCTHVVEAMLALTDVILGGTLERFPGVRIGAAESHIHWVAGWLALMDQQFGTGLKIWSDKSGEKKLGLKPSDYFKRQCFVAAFPEDTIIREALAAAPQSILVASDWPHPIASVHAKTGLDYVSQRDDLSTAEKDALLLINPKRFL
jgi:predicted TIM-barrel fold metal-dependent hydrolase